MQIKPLFALAAFALTAKADQAIAVGKGGALDFSKSGGVAIAGRAVPEANQAAHGPVAMGGAMDFSKSSKKQGKRAGPPQPEHATTCTEEDRPWIPEWTPGATYVGEAPEPIETTSVAAVSSSSVLQKGQVVTSASSSSSVAIPTTKVVPTATPILPSVVPSVRSSSSGFNVSTIAHASSTTGVTFTRVTSATSIPSVVAPITTHAVSPVVPSSSSVLVSSASSSSIPVSSVTTPLPKAAGTSTHPSSSTPAPTSTKSSSSSSVHTTSAPAAPATTSGPVAPFTHGPVTFRIINSMPGSITISYQLGTYSPATGGPTTVASSLIGPSATTGVFATETTVVAPVGWAGRMTIGKAGGPLDYRGTKIEGNNGFDGADPHADPDPDVDVSYVDGYSVPASCSCGAEVLTGCNKELFDLGNKCSNLAGDADHPVCVNDPRNIHGPANGFFAPCKAAAYTYDFDDVANWQGTCAGNTITCCIGTKCPSPDRQPKAKNKREMLALMSAEKRAAAIIEA